MQVIENEEGQSVEVYTAEEVAAQKVEALDESILNKALIRFYLNQATQSIVAEHARTLAASSEQNNSQLQELKARMAELNELLEQVVDPSFDKTINSKIHSYVEKNKNWLRSYLADLEQLSNCLGIPK